MSIDMKRKIFTLALLTVCIVMALNRVNAQFVKVGKFRASLSLQNEVYWAKDKTLKPRLMSNNYISWKSSYTFNKNFVTEFGLRYEYLKNPLPGFESNRGQGLPYAYCKLSLKKVQLTLGSFYEQFGSGMLLRLYEDRTLGIDNQLFGAKILYQPIDGLRLKTLAGVQRNHFESYIGKNPLKGGAAGFDLEYDLQQHLSFLKKNNYIVQLGLAYVLKGQWQFDDIFSQDLKYMLYQPFCIAAFSPRLHIMKGGFDIFGEYALKYNDPTRGNDYTYGNGSVAMLNLSYATTGLSVLLGARRSENFDFRSFNSADGIDYRINHLLPFTPQRTYTLSALYPYATQGKGEWALQGELRYRLKKGTWYGGRYGTELHLTASYITGLRAKNPTEADLLLKGDKSLIGTNGVATNIFGFGQKYFHDFGIELSRKINKNYRFSLLYSNQSYNDFVLQGEGEMSKPILSHIFVYDGKHKFSPNVGLRTELQYSYSKQALGDWCYAGAELSLFSNYLISISDQYNINGQHYPMFSLAATQDYFRIQLSYGKTRAGINCSGGVCRYMPATEGFYLSLNANL